jgi:uncharacterized protein
MAKLSLQEQLLKSGLVGKGQARAVKSEKHKQTKQQQHNKAVIANDAKEKAQKAQLEQAERDRGLNRIRQQEDERKHLAAQVRQLIEQNRLPQHKVITDDSLAYHFTDNNKVKTVYVSKDMRDQITQGTLAIVRLGKQYEVVPAEIGLKIKVRDGTGIMVFNQALDSLHNQEDPYPTIKSLMIWSGS